MEDMPEVTSMVEDVVLQTDDVTSADEEAAPEVADAASAPPEGEPEREAPPVPEVVCRMDGRWTSGSGTGTSGSSRTRTIDQDHCTGKSARNLASSSPE